MVKRLAVLFLWLWAGWTVGSFVSFAWGVPELIGPAFGLLALAVAALVPPIRQSVNRVGASASSQTQPAAPPAG